MKRIYVLIQSLVIGLAGAPLTASASNDHAAAHASHAAAKPVATVQTTSSSAAAASNNAITEGEIRKVDKDAGKITIKHAELKNLDMPPMTMPFQVKDKAMLDQVKAGDKVSFVAHKVNGRLTVVQIETKK